MYYIVLAGTRPDWRYCQINSIIIDLHVWRMKITNISKIEHHLF